MRNQHKTTDDDDIWMQLVLDSKIHLIYFEFQSLSLSSLELHELFKIWIWFIFINNSDLSIIQKKKT